MVALADIIGRGDTASRPAAGTEGRLYFDTDDDTLYRDNGSVWESVERADSSTLTVREEDGTPSDTAVTIIRVTNGTLTDNGAGDVSLDLSGGGGGGGAPTTATYVTTAADGTLSAEKVLPFLGNYSPDKAPASPSADDDEFDDDTLDAAWSQFGSPDTVSENTYHGYLVIEDNDAANCGVRKAFAPGANAFTVVICCNFQASTNFSFMELQLTDSSDTTIEMMGIQRTTSGTMQYRYSTAPATAAIGGIYGPRLYLAIQRDATTNYSIYISNDGMGWIPVVAESKAGTVAKVGLAVNGQGSGVARLVVDFIRFFTSQTLTIGGTP